MKYLILVPDGLADEPVEELGGKTPMEAAETPNMDFLVQNGVSALVQTIPDGLPPGSDIGNLALMGYDPKKNFSGRACLEAANLGIKLKDDEVVFRCNLVFVKDDKMVDYSAGHIDSDEAKNLIEHLERTLDWPDVRFYPGKSYRHLMVIKSINAPVMSAVKTTPPHDIMDRSIQAYLPAGPQSDVLVKIMEKSKSILGTHQINKLRRDAGENPGNMVWLWGQGTRPQLPLFKDRWGLTGSVISAVDLVNGIGRLAGLDVIDVPGANGYYDTNYQGKAESALDSLKTHDFVYVHVEATDEAGHNGDWKAKKECCEHFDKKVVGTILKHFKKPQGVRILVSPDHPTPVAVRSHTRAPVPFVMWGDGIKPEGAPSYSEKAASKQGLRFKSGEAMIEFFLK
ncbi:MAG: cofactor-independent phosphoglycerate mutase [Candidatus Omnitrophica bacterium]|nr:cofactor-independent phosphoglycerate mutase [Candidatus Omnitrophota bacterium]MDE2223270.1 cofactor-independent phosphoglycerate mutase [Candidatus Omnitrophota bacterium]